jgi:ComF family protein
MAADVTALGRGLQNLLDLFLPPQCLACGEEVAGDGGLCAACWPRTPFIRGLVCDTCGTPLPGTDEGRPEYCDDCRTIARPWGRGRAALLYRDTGRDLVLSLKHADRLEIAVAAARWMVQAARPILEPGMLVTPVPLHWMRLLRRRTNQAAELAREVARAGGLAFCPDLLVRRRATPTQEGRSRDGRFANLDAAIALHPRRRGAVAGRHVLIVDDVMTSGATFAAAADACHAAGASRVSVLALARVAKDA